MDILGGACLAEKGIRVNCISPGPTDTPMMADFESAYGKEFMDNFPVPLGRHSTPDEQAWPLIFLNLKVGELHDR